MIDGKKYIGFLNSWGDTVGEKGWQFIGEDYFNSQYGFFDNPYIMTYDPQIVPPVSMPVLRLGSRGMLLKLCRQN